MQILLLTFAGSAFHVYGNYGLTVQQWALCFAIGLGSIPVNLLLKIKKLEEKEPQAEGQETVEKKKVRSEISRDDPEPTKDELHTDSHIIKIREIPKFGETKFKAPPLNREKYKERNEIVSLGFH